jgi:hypothetical protein
VTVAIEFTQPVVASMTDMFLWWYNFFCWATFAHLKPLQNHLVKVLGNTGATSGQIHSQFSVQFFIAL